MSIKYRSDDLFDCYGEDGVIRELCYRAKSVPWNRIVGLLEKHRRHWSPSYDQPKRPLIPIHINPKCASSQASTPALVGSQSRMWPMAFPTDSLECSRATSSSTTCSDKSRPTILHTALPMKPRNNSRATRSVVSSPDSSWLMYLLQLRLNYAWDTCLLKSPLTALLPIQFAVGISSHLFFSVSN